MTAILSPVGRHSGSCGYCTEPGSGERSESESSWSTGASVLRLSPSIYQALIDRGWRRSGMYCYKPDLIASCCPQYTIRLDALDFSPSKSQRKLINRWNRYIEFGDNKENNVEVEDDLRQKQKSKGGASTFSSLVQKLHASEASFDQKESFKHKFEVILEPASYTEEKFNLFQSYQTHIHNDPSTPGSFRRFLVESPIFMEPIPYTSDPADYLPKTYGSYHQLYRVDGKLIAMGVLDILPHCVSSVYFMYDTRWERFSLGKLSAMREVLLARELYEAGISELKWLYMGFYIHSCQKMRYKGEYAPSYLLDPEIFEWFPIKECTPLLDKYRYASFAHPERAQNQVINLDPTQELVEGILENVNVITATSSRQITVAPPRRSRFWSDPITRQEIIDVVAALGDSLSADVLLLCE